MRIGGFVWDSLVLECEYEWHNIICVEYSDKNLSG